MAYRQPGPRGGATLARGDRDERTAPPLSVNAASLVSDPAPANNIATASVVVTPRPTTLTLTLDPATVHVGSGSVATMTVIDGATGASNPVGKCGLRQRRRRRHAVGPVLHARAGAGDDRSLVVSGHRDARHRAPRTVTASYAGTASTTRRPPRNPDCHAASDDAHADARPGDGARRQRQRGHRDRDRWSDGASNPAGTVGFVSAGGGDTLSAPSCTLAPVPATTDRASCQVTVTPGTAAARTVTASTPATASTTRRPPPRP